MVHRSGTARAVRARGRQYAGMLAWTLPGITAVLALLIVWLAVLSHLGGLQRIVDFVPFVVFTVVGAVIASRRPTNSIGWLFCVIGLTNILSQFATEYATYALVTQPGSLPGGTVMAWLATNWPADLGWGLMGLFVPLLFQTGHLLSPRWRIAAWLAGATVTLQVGYFMFRPGRVPLLGHGSVRNPLGLSALSGVGSQLSIAVDLLILAALITAILSLVLRFRRSRGEERAQLKWFAYAAGVLGTLIALSIVNSDTVHNQTVDRLLEPLFVLAVCGLPVAAAIAILKYRLYDIDVLINRTLVYGLLTICLGLVYMAGVIGLQALFRVLTGQGSNAAIALSTLAIAALFQPFRRRIQGMIDRRFYRRKYDADRALAAFSARLREDVDLDQLTREIVAAVQETLQPAHISLWLR